MRTPLTAVNACRVDDAPIAVRMHFIRYGKNCSDSVLRTTAVVRVGHGRSCETIHRLGPRVTTVLAENRISAPRGGLYGVTRARSRCDATTGPIVLARSRVIGTPTTYIGVDDVRLTSPRAITPIHHSLSPRQHIRSVDMTAAG
jgi:hypothetical protein